MKNIGFLDLQRIAVESGTYVSFKTNPLRPEPGTDIAINYSDDYYYASELFAYRGMNSTLFFHRKYPDFPDQFIAFHDRVYKELDLIRKSELHSNITEETNELTKRRQSLSIIKDFRFLYEPRVHENFFPR